MNYKQTLLNTNRFSENEYLDKYIELLKTNKNKVFESGVTQKHNIIPRHVFTAINIPTDDSDNNLIVLTFADHILAHYYLALAANNVKDRFSNELAVLRMIGDSDLSLEDRRWIKNLDKYQELYEDSQQNNRNAHIGKTPWNKGKTYSTVPCPEDKKKIIKDKATGRYVGDCWIHKGTLNKHVPKDQLEYYLSKGFELGRNDLEAFQKISESQKLNPNRSMLGRKQSDYQKQRVSELMLGVPKSDNARANMSKAKKGKIMVSNDETKHCLFVEKHEFDAYVQKGYHRGKPISK